MHGIAFIKAAEVGIRAVKHDSHQIHPEVEIKAAGRRIMRAGQPYSDMESMLVRAKPSRSGACSSCASRSVVLSCFTLACLIFSCSLQKKGFTASGFHSVRRQLWCVARGLRPVACRHRKVWPCSTTATEKGTPSQALQICSMAAGIYRQSDGRHAHLIRRTGAKASGSSVCHGTGSLLAAALRRLLRKWPAGKRLHPRLQHCLLQRQTCMRHSALLSVDP